MIKDLNIIIPLRDEDEQVKTTVHMLINELKDLKKIFVITLIDDHSNDATWDLLKELREKYNNITAFTFVDDIMAKASDWFDEFARRYKEEIGLPYVCTSQPLYFNEKLAK